MNSRVKARFSTLTFMSLVSYKLQNLTFPHKSMNQQYLQIKTVQKKMVLRINIKINCIISLHISYTLLKLYFVYIQSVHHAVKIYCFSIPSAYNSFLFCKNASDFFM